MQMIDDSISKYRKEEDYKKVMDMQVKALKVLNKRLKERDSEIVELNKKIGNLRWLLRTKNY